MSSDDSSQGTGPAQDADTDVDCARALERMFSFIDNELPGADFAEIQRHLDECAPCLGKYDLERTVKALVARSCSERAPESLRQRVLVHIREVHYRFKTD
jgi:mycothiol system anti-sigma-R factor